MSLSEQSQEPAFAGVATDGNAVPNPTGPTRPVTSTKV
jgi:hypothetical protein